MDRCNIALYRLSNCKILAESYRGAINKLQQQSIEVDISIDTLSVVALLLLQFTACYLSTARFAQFAKIFVTCIYA